MEIQTNLYRTKDEIAGACQRAKRDPGDVTLIAVSKTKPIELLQEAYDGGAREFGENRVQELLTKIPLMPKDVKWHLIGHLQTNKVRQIIGKTCLIHSVDSVKLAGEIEKESNKQGIVTDILLEVNVAREESKFGFLLEEVEEALRSIQIFSHVKVCGLMTVAPFVEDAEKNRAVYVDMKTKNIDNGSMTILSMGMTGDFQVAVEEGSTMVRVGTGIFGAR